MLLPKLTKLSKEKVEKVTDKKTIIREVEDMFIIDKKIIIDKNKELKDEDTKHEDRKTGDKKEEEVKTEADNQTMTRPELKFGIRNEMNEDPPAHEERPTSEREDAECTPTQSKRIRKNMRSNSINFSSPTLKLVKINSIRKTFEQSVSHRQRISEDNFTSRNKVDNPKTVVNPFMFSGPIEKQDESLLEDE